MRFRFYQCAAVAAIAVAIGTPARAQEAVSSAPAASATDSDQGLGEIVVTARRREESLQSVPISITALSGEDLRTRNVIVLQDLQNATPNLKIKNGGGNASAAVYSIRGQVNSEIIATQDASVGLYVDDLIWSRAMGVNGSLLDMASAQVLKGPQGTLFGRNTTGGAIVLRTNDPDTDEISGSLKLGYDRFNRFEGAAILNVPLVDDAVALRGAIQRIKADPQYRNRVGGNDGGSEDSWTGRVKLLVKPIDDVRLVVSYEHFYTDQDSPPWYASYFDTSAAGANFAIAAQQAAGANFGPIQQYLHGPDFTQTTNNDLNRHHAKTDTVNGILTWDVGGITVKAIGGYRSTFHHTLQDLDGTPYTILKTDGQQSIKQYSGELQIIGKAFDDRLDYTVGGFLFKESGFDTSTSIAIPPVNPANPNFTYGDVKNTSKAIYGQVSYKVTDSLGFTGGLRYSSDTKRLVSQNRSGTGATLTCSIPVSLRVNATTCTSIPLNNTDSGWSYTAGFDYQFDSSNMVYIKTSRGFRAGGFNLRASGDPALFTPFGPEKVTDYEIGFKSEFFDRRIRFNVAAFYSDYDDIQRSSGRVITTAQGGIAQISTVVNAATARILGGEAELTAIVADGLQLNGAIGLTYPKYLEFTEPRIVNGQVVQIDRSDETFDFVPKMTANIGIQYQKDVGIGSIMLRADYNYTSTIYNQSNNPTPRTVIKPVGLVNARAAVTLDQNLEIGVYGQNIFGKRYDVWILDNSSSLGVDGHIAAPRPTFGADVTYRF